MRNTRLGRSDRGLAIPNARAASTIRRRNAITAISLTPTCSWQRSPMGPINSHITISWFGDALDAGEVADLHSSAILLIKVGAVRTLLKWRSTSLPHSSTLNLRHAVGIDARLVGPIPGDEIENRLVVVFRRKQSRHIVDVVWRNQCSKRRDIDRRADIIVSGLVHDRTTDRGITKAIACALDLKSRSLVGRRAAASSLPLPLHHPLAQAPCRRNAGSMNGRSRSDLPALAPNCSVRAPSSR